MAYAQWVVIEIKAERATLSIRNPQLTWGKFYRDPNKDDEISIDDIAKIEIPGGESVRIASCGRSDAASGTEGRFDLYSGTDPVGNYYWCCPWGSKTNTSRWTPSSNDHYIAQVTGGNLDSGALGNVKIRCCYIS